MQKTGLKWHNQHGHVYMQVGDCGSSWKMGLHACKHHLETQFGDSFNSVFLAHFDSLFLAHQLINSTLVNWKKMVIFLYQSKVEKMTVVELNMEVNCSGHRGYPKLKLITNTTEVQKKQYF